jgi:transcriptional antiterminator RfaH
MTETSASPINSTAWYVVHTKPRQEELALLHLQRQGYVCYFPRLKVEKVRQRKLQLITEPMFSRYLFIQLDSGSTVGVSQMVYFGSRPAMVDAALIHELQSREESLPEQILFKAGDRVQIKQGPFAGLEAVYQLKDAQQRALVLLELLSKKVTLPIDPAHLAMI